MHPNVDFGEALRRETGSRVIRNDKNSTLFEFDIPCFTNHFTALL